MKPLPVYFYLIVFLIGGLVSRECVTGALQKAEQAYSAWLEETTAPNPIPQITLITADTSGQLTSLDVALFLRAAVQFKAKVAAIAAFDFAPGDEDLLGSVLGRKSRTAVVAGALLTDAMGGTGNFETVQWPDAGTLSHFKGVRNNLPTDSNPALGFLNLPGKESSESIPVLAQLDQQTVTSFSFACLTQYLAGNEIALGPKAIGMDLVFSNQSRLNLAAGGVVKLLPDTYSQIARFSLGDLLVAAEKVEQDSTTKADVLEAIRDRIVILAAAPSNAEISAGTFTMGQFQALGVSSLISQMHRLNLGMWIWWIPFVWFFPWLKISESWTISNQIAGLILVAATYGLFSISVAQEFGVFLPGIPALAWFLSILGVLIVRRKSASA